MTSFIYTGIIASTCYLRKYPPGFGAAIARLYPQLVSGAEGVPDVDETQEAWVVFENMPFTTWPEAHLGPSLKYLRGNKHLDLPEAWLKAMPRLLEILHALSQR